MKVKLPKKVCEALDDFKSTGHDTDYIISCLCASEERAMSHRLKTLYDFALKNGFLVVSALLGEYEPIEEDITVTITPQIQDRVRECFKAVTPTGWKFRGLANDHVYQQRCAMRSVLYVFGIEVEGAQNEIKITKI